MFSTVLLYLKSSAVTRVLLFFKPMKLFYIVHSICIIELYYISLQYEQITCALMEASTQFC